MADQPTNSNAADFDPYHVWLSIAPDEQPPHHYRLLGLKPFESDLRVIESAADRQMAHVRTFQSGKYSKASQKLLNEISTAKVCLLNATNKQAYDQKLKASLGESAAAAKPVVKSAARPAPLTAKPLPDRAAPARGKANAPNTAADAAGAGGFVFNAPRPGAGRSRVSQRKSNMMIPAVVVLVLVVLVAVVAFIATHGNDDATARHDESAVPVAPPTLPPAEDTQIDDGELTPQPPIAPATDPPDELPAQTDARPNDDSRQDDTPAPHGNDAPEIHDPLQPQSPIESIENIPAGQQVVPDKKSPIPDDDDVRANEQLARQLFATEFSGAESPEAKSSLSVKLLDSAEHAATHAERYALTQLAYGLASEAGDVNLISNAIAALDRAFEVDALQLRADAYVKANRQRRTGSELEAFTATLLEPMQAAARADRYDVVEAVRDEIADNIRKINDIEAKKQIAAQLKVSREQEKRFAAAQRAKETLAGDPDNAASHLLLGEYLCFVKRDWPAGLEHLARGSDTALKENLSQRPRGRLVAGRSTGAGQSLGRVGRQCRRDGQRRRAFARGPLVSARGRTTRRRAIQVAG